MKSLKTAIKVASLALAFGALAPAVQAQTTTTTYAYSASITLGSPVGTSAAGTPAKNKPVGIKVLPCLSPGNDGLTFTLKYDAGKLLATADGEVQSDSRKDVYVIFSKDSVTAGVTAGAQIVQLWRDPAAATIFGTQAPSLTLVATAPAIAPAKTYYDNLKVLSGAQTEIIFGGPIGLEALASGIWAATVIIADSATVNFDDPSTWLAWDTVPFLLGKPWTGTTNNTCL